MSVTIDDGIDIKLLDVMTVKGVKSQGQCFHFTRKINEEQKEDKKSTIITEKTHPFVLCS